MKFYIGTYTSGFSRGIYQANLDVETGALSEPELVAELDNPAFLTLHPSGAFLFACSEIRRDGKREGAKLVAYRIEKDGRLIYLNSQATGGSGPCFVSTDVGGRVALVAHYASGSVVSLPIAADGTLGPISGLNQHSGSGPRSERQEGPHAHCIVPDPSNRFACAIDLGIDQVAMYAIEPFVGTIASKPTNIFHALPGSGPRHLTFHPSGRFAFLIHELANTLSALSWDANRCALDELHSLSTLPDDFRGESITAEVLVHPTGRFVYGSNRGHDSLVVFEFDAVVNRLKCLQYISCGGITPRNFRIDPSGRTLLSANQESNSIVAFHVNRDSGLLTMSGQSITIGSPSCIKFVTTQAN